MQESKRDNCGDLGVDHNKIEQKGIEVMIRQGDRI
jgi:hypothetical protein